MEETVHDYHFINDKELVSLSEMKLWNIDTVTQKNAKRCTLTKKLVGLGCKFIPCGMWIKG